MKKIILFGISTVLLFTVIILLELFSSNSTEKQNYLEAEINSANSKKHQITEVKTSSNGVYDTSNRPIHDFLALENLWQSSFPKRMIETDFNSFMSVSSFISIYQPMADEGDLTAQYLISTSIMNCLSVENEYSQFDKNISNINDSFIQNKYEVLLNDYQRCEDFLMNYNKQDRMKFLNKSGNIYFSLLVPELTDINNVESYFIEEDRLELYSNFNTGTKGVRKLPIDRENALFLEIIKKVKDPVSLDAAFTLLSSVSSFNEYEPYNNELAAWLIASCSGGYGCKKILSQAGGDKAFCYDKKIDCFNKSPEELVSALVPKSNYDQIITRAWQISQRIINGEQEQLILELLSTMSPENAQKYEDLSK